MPQFPFHILDGTIPGSLNVEQSSVHEVEVFYTPSSERLDEAWPYTADIDQVRIKLLLFDTSDHSVTMFPTHTRVSFGRFLQPKYDQIRRITITDHGYMGAGLYHTPPKTEDEVAKILEKLPSCFLTYYDSGLGFALRYRFIINAIESLSNCSDLVISDDCETGPDTDENIYYISTGDLETIRKEIDKTINHGRSAMTSVNRVRTHNYLAAKLDQPLIEPTYGRHPLRRHFTDVLLQRDDYLPSEDQEKLVDTLAKHAGSIAKTKPQKLASLKNDIELATLDNLITRYEQMIEYTHPENTWQEFLQANTFILSLAFGYPVLNVQGKPSVGGHRLSGSGNKFGDFLVKNSMTNNSALVEIKTPQTRLLNSRPIRPDVFTPSSELVGAVNQVLNQKYHFEQGIAQIRSNNRLYDIESYSVRCCLIISKLPTNEDKLKSFELFRGNSKNVDIITFDELLGKLKQLRELLTSPDDVTAENIELNKLPF